MTGPTVRWTYQSLVEQVKANSIADENDCWLWIYGVWATNAPINRYPRITIKGLQRNVVRHLLFAVTGEWGEEACHSCDVSRCVNPAHVRWGTKLDNVQDMRDRDRFARGEQPTHWTKRVGEQERNQRSKQQKEFWAQEEIKQRHSDLMKRVKMKENADARILGA